MIVLMIMRMIIEQNGSGDIDSHDVGIVVVVMVARMTVVEIHHDTFNDGDNSQ